MTLKIGRVEIDAAQDSVFNVKCVHLEVKVAIAGNNLSVEK